VCLRLSRLPRGDLTAPERIFAVGELDDAAVGILDNAIVALMRQPSRGVAIVRVTEELNRIVADSQRKGALAAGLSRERISYPARQADAAVWFCAADVEGPPNGPAARSPNTF